MLRAGQVLGGYRVEAVIGSGGQATVYRALQLSLQRPVALKVIAPEGGPDPRLRERFAREGIAAASLDHPHVIPVHEAGEIDGVPFLAMKLVDGPSLASLIARGLERGRALAILEQVAEALDYLAGRGMVHRDVKPANVLVAAGDHAYLCDFGLATADDLFADAPTTSTLVAFQAGRTAVLVRGDTRAQALAVARTLLPLLPG